MAKRSPPTPFIAGSMSPIAALVAMAASTALPPCSRICTPARAASGWLAATIPYFVMTIERPVTGRRERDESVWATAVWVARAKPARQAMYARAVMTGASGRRLDGAHERRANDAPCGRGAVERLRVGFRRQLVREDSRTPRQLG